MAIAHQETTEAQGESDIKNHAKREEFERIAAAAVQQYRLSMRGTMMITESDAAQYERYIHSDISWKQFGASSYEARIKSVQDDITRWIPDMERKARMLERDVLEKLQTSAQRGWLNASSVEHWLQRLQDNGTDHWKKEEFIEKEFPAYYKNWREVATRRTSLLKNPSIKLITPRDVGHITSFLDQEKFLNLHYDERAGLVAEVEAAIMATGNGRTTPQLFKDAKDMFEKAAVEGVIGRNQVGPILKMIIASAPNTQTLRSFIEGTADFTIAKYIDKHRTHRKRFDAIQERKKKEGIPRSFHFVTLDVFLNWDYEKKDADLAEAEERFTEINDERYDFLEIRHALDVKDWNEAEELIAEARTQHLGPADRRKLDSMERYLAEHRGTSAMKGKEEPPTEEILLAMRTALASVPSECIRDLLERALFTQDSQVLKATGSCIYNRVWCWDHHFLDRNRELELLEESQDETYDHLRHGHGTRFENNKISGDTAEGGAARQSHDTRAAQILHINKTSNATLIHSVIQPNKLNRSFWYWTSFIPEDLPIEHQRYIVYTVLPILKSGMRTLQKRGVAFTTLGPPQKMQKSTLQGQPKQHSAQPSYALSV